MASENIVIATESNFKDTVLSSAQPVLVDFWAEWCGPCKMIAPVLDELATEYGGKIKVAKVNIDENQNLAAQYRVTAIPTLFVLNNWQVMDDKVCYKGKTDTQGKLKTCV